jgi:hypothetical protein
MEHIEFDYERLLKRINTVYAQELYSSDDSDDITPNTIRHMFEVLSESNVLFSRAMAKLTDLSDFMEVIQTLYEDIVDNFDEYREEYYVNRVDINSPLPCVPALAPVISGVNTCSPVV